jgi:predicted nucleic acid-binding protein
LDAAYLTLAQELDGVRWTLDGRLVRNAARLKLPVQLAAS